MTGDTKTRSGQAYVDILHSGSREVRQDRLTALSVGLTRTHTVAPDTLLDEVRSHGLREADHSGLGGAVHTSVHNSWGKGGLSNGRNEKHSLLQKRSTNKCPQQPWPCSPHPTLLKNYQFFPP